MTISNILLEQTRNILNINIILKYNKVLEGIQIILASSRQDESRIPESELELFLNLASSLLGEKFRSDDTIHTIIRKILDKAKLRAKLYSFPPPTVHVTGGIYRALVFVFYIKLTIMPST
jgi:hypothetical protein